jgi:methionyl-tRNA formyltransferase
MKVIFLGTPEFAAEVLEHVVTNSHHQIVAVVSRPDARRGRGLEFQPTPVKKKSQLLLPTVPIFQPSRASTPACIEQLLPFDADVFLVVAYGELIGSDLLRVPRLGCYNIHASLLPSYRGAAPIQRALIDGCEKTGISIFRLTKGMDSGDVIWKESCSIGPDTNVEELTSQLLEIAKRGSVEALDLLESGRAVFTPQYHEEATLAPKITPEDLQLNQTSDVCALHDRIRAFAPSPGAFFMVQYRERTFRFKVLKSHVDLTASHSCRQWRVMNDGSLALASPEGTLVLDCVQLEGKVPMSSSAFLRGVPLQEILFLT